MDEDQAYRAMDLLVEADAQAKVQEAVFFAVADLLNLEVDLLLFDTSSTYFFSRELHQTGDGVALWAGRGGLSVGGVGLVVWGFGVSGGTIPAR